MAPRTAEVLAVGGEAHLVRVEGAEAAASLALWLRSQDLRCTEVVPAATSVLVDGTADADHLRRLVEQWQPSGLRSADAPLVEVPVSYDGPDLSEVARRWGVTREEVVRRHTGVEFVATFSGFAPGFSYLSGLPSDWALPRRDSPRARVPAGSVALADVWCGIYPTPSPGGWWLLGRTDVVVWDLAREQGPALLPPGTRVRFVVA
ncbi:allophanate hydrolase subunit 1 [Nocardioides sp. Y6]|uniref:Allophanate hydrolase subunit 1 n=2 Tax=Nocardioides malaquae TaxID=2773426 RepID=A0ABR9RNS7_9ACTN|nr:allophanate hydrolase subunit 1 [Nocardioides malaquae]